MKKDKIYIVYDERARTMDLCGCTVILSTQNKKFAFQEAEESRGVIEECDFDGKTATNGVIIN